MVMVSMVMVVMVMLVAVMGVIEVKGDGISNGDGGDRDCHS